VGNQQQDFPALKVQRNINNLLEVVKFEGNWNCMKGGRFTRAQFSESQLGLTESERILYRKIYERAVDAGGVLDGEALF